MSSSTPEPPSIPTLSQTIPSTLSDLNNNRESLYGMQSNDLYDQLAYLKSAYPRVASLLSSQAGTSAGLDSAYSQAAANASYDALANLVPRQLEIANRYGSDYNKLLSDPQTEALRQAIVSGAQDFQGLSSSTPAADALRRTLSSQASSDLSSGSGLSPALAREIQQYVRAGQSARGLTMGSAPVSAEAFALGSRGLQLQDSRRQFASDVANLLDAAQANKISLSQNKAQMASSAAQANESLRPRGAEYAAGTLGTSSAAASLAQQAAALAGGNMSSLARSSASPSITLSGLFPNMLSADQATNAQNVSNAYNYNVSQSAANDAWKMGLFQLGGAALGAIGGGVMGGLGGGTAASSANATGKGLSSAAGSMGGGFGSYMPALYGASLGGNLGSQFGGMAGNAMLGPRNYYTMGR